MRFTFSIEKLKPIVAHARAAKRHHTAGQAGRAQPGLLLINDAGVYLMSNGTPRQMPEGATEGRALVVHAEGHDWDTHLGGDDYVEVLDLGAFEDAIKADHSRIIIEVTANSVAVFSDKLMSIDDARKQVLDWLATENVLTILPTPSHDKFRMIPATHRAMLSTKWPKAIVLNDMPFEAAVKLYATKRGIAA